MGYSIIHISTNKYWLCLPDILPKPGKLLLAQCTSCCSSSGPDQQEGVCEDILLFDVILCHSQRKKKGLLVTSEKGHGFHSRIGVVDGAIRVGATSCGHVLSCLVRLSDHFACKSPSFFFCTLLLSIFLLLLFIFLPCCCF